MQDSRPDPGCELLAAALRGEAPTWPGGHDAAFTATLGETALRHGVDLLAAWRLSKSAAWRTWPDSLRERWARALRQAAAVELLECRELASALAALKDCGARPVLMKGAALARTHYPQPFLRPRGDVDILVAPDSVQAARRTLRDAGYRVPEAPLQRLVSTQFMAGTALAPGVTMTLDIHFAVSNRQSFARALSHGDAAARATLVPGLGENVFGLCPVDALLFACMHRAGHLCEGQGDRLIWLFDIHLLSDGLAEPEWDDLVRRAADARVAAVVRAGLVAAQARFGTAIDPAVLRDLSGREQDELSAGLLRAGPARALWLDFRALPDAHSRVVFASELLFPPSGHLLAKYGVRHRAWLPWLYLRRGFEGIAKRVRTRTG